MPSYSVRDVERVLRLAPQTTRDASIVSLSRI
jgi:hypothetical protein